MQAQGRHWFLEGYLDDRHSLQRLAIHASPYRVGRQDDLELSLDDAEISRLHAELELRGDALFIRDLGSTNGTAVNREPVTEDTLLREGDIVNFGAVELRVSSRSASDDRFASEVTRLSRAVGPHKLPTGSRELGELLASENVTALFQPLFSLDGDIHGWEILGRGTHAGLAASPLDLFRIAESVEREVELSDLFRRKGIGIAAETYPQGLYFVNTHPREIEDIGTLMRAIEALRTGYPELRIGVELHEAAFADLAVLKRLRDDLLALDIPLAFDDFGAGQARLVELAETPPEYIKVDIALIRDIDQASPARRSMLEMVLDISHRVGSQVVAEGVSREGELEACRELGFDLLQGFHLGRPHPAEQLPSR